MSFNPLFTPRYCNSFDGKLLELASGSKEASIAAMSERLKFAALFGLRFQVSDNNIVDSPVFQHLFSDSGFRTFLKQDPKFLSLVSNPESEGNTRWELATSQLARIENQRNDKGEQTWESSSGDTASLRDLAQRVLSRGERGIEHCEIDDLGGDHNNSPNERRRREGVLEAVKHFYGEEAVSERSQQVDKVHWDDVAREWVNNGHDTDGLVSRLLAIAAEIESGNKRSPLQKYLEEDMPRLSPDTLERNRLLGALVQAWAVSVGRSIGASSKSFSALPNIPTFVDKIESVQAIIGEGNTPRLETLRPGWTREWRVSRRPLTWERVADVANRTKTPRRELRRAAGAEIEGRLRSLLTAMTEEIVPPLAGNLMFAVGSGVVLFLGFAAATIFTTDDAPSEIMKELAAQFGQAVTGGSAIAAGTAIWRNRVYKTLDRKADRLVRQSD